MDAVQKHHWYFVVLLFLPSLKVAVVQTEGSTVRLEEDMVLSCLCPWNGNLSSVSWTKDPDKSSIAVYHPEHGEHIPSPYTERVVFLKTTHMDGSISMRNVTHQDIGTYHCSVQTFPRGPWTQSIQVEDLDEPPEDSTEEEEEEEEGSDPPTLDGIRTDTELVAEPDSNLTISCNHEHNGTVYQVVLERVPPGPSGIIGICKKVDGGGLLKEGELLEEDYSERGQVSCEDSLDVSLHLTGVQAEDGGLYRCTFSTDAGVRTTTVLLTVPPQGGFSLSVYMMCVYVGAGTAFLILLIIIIVLAVNRRKKHRREEYRVKLHPSQRQPNIYENIPPCPRTAKKPRQIKNPVYANINTKWRQWQRQ
ncbi:CD226 antigen isoform X2 [Trematomus bernacchii]|uniref:CD226 antigen isoform X2 n=1 Tax=Trematomus bernacchii TaxID=40690 RepID=UPI00146CE999|nr:CD226 antigen isoform X2 [Trematomus bernacchii]